MFTLVENELGDVRPEYICVETYPYSMGKTTATRLKFEYYEKMTAATDILTWKTIFNGWHVGGSVEQSFYFMYKGDILYVHDSFEELEERFWAIGEFCYFESGCNCEECRIGALVKYTNKPYEEVRAALRRLFDVPIDEVKDD